MQAWIVSKHISELELTEYQVVPCADDVPDDFYLTLENNSWCLCDKQSRFPSISIDFSDPYYRYRGGIEYLPKAFKGMMGANLADVTAGWGRDAWLLAYRGFSVMLYERNPYLAFLLKKAIYFAQQSENRQLAEIASRMTFVQQDACELNKAYDAIYMDPMFPERHKKAKVKKHMQALHCLLGGEEGDGNLLLKSALLHVSHRVVVKRPKGAPFIGGDKPSRSIDAPNTRYDIYLP